MPENINYEKNEYPKTKFFQACRGVFQGGGCKGAAHIGAYEAASRCGVNFSEVAGTSAGSIIAALVGAGATPEFLLKKCAYLKFSELLISPQKRIATPWLFRMMGFVLKYFIARFDEQQKLLSKILIAGSAYSSEKLEDWLNDLLSELLPNAERPIKFKDMVLPTWVVAADLSGQRPKVWSTQDTPDSVVATAVRSSCSIPLFFEPVESGNNLFVDGGVLSNLPSFVFANRDHDMRALGGRVLAFRLLANEETRTKMTISWVLKRLIDTIISGATHIQNSIQNNVSSVEINTGDVSGTNFDITKKEVDFLLDSGREAMKNFIRNEYAALNDSLTTDIARYSEDELFDDLTREMSVPGKRLVISCRDTLWYWKLFPSVIYWMFKGAKVDIIVNPALNSQREMERRDMLKKMGARIVETSHPSLNCFLLIREDDRKNAAFIQDISETEFTPKGVVYIGTLHRPVIAMLLRTIDEILGPDSASGRTLTLKESSPEKLITRLKSGVNQYNMPDVTIEIKEIDLKDGETKARMIVKRVRSFKYRQIAHLVSLYRDYCITFCMPADIMADGEYVSTVTPPVFEEWGDNLISIEGNTRMYYQFKAGTKSIHGFVVKGVSAPLPGQPVDLSKVLLSTFQLRPDKRINDFNYENFRSIEGAVRI